MPLQTKQKQYIDSPVLTGHDLISFPFNSTGTWSPIQNMFAYVLVIGGGGGGGASYASGAQTGAVPRRACASGGGAGGAALSLLELRKDITYSYTTGAGAARVSTTSATSGGRNATGNTGSASTFSGSGIPTMTANGGNGGNGDFSDDSDNSAAGVTGGTASGGNVYNRTGGGSGFAASQSVTTSDCIPVSSGGGAPQVFVDPADEVLNSGNITRTSANFGSSGGGANSHGASPDMTGGTNRVQGGADLGNGTLDLEAFHNPVTSFESTNRSIQSIFGRFFHLSGPPDNDNLIRGTNNNIGATSFSGIRIYGAGGFSDSTSATNDQGPPSPGIGGGGGGGALVRNTGAATLVSGGIGGDGAIYILPVKVEI
jgi:hypothetical protein